MLIKQLKIFCIFLSVLLWTYGFTIQAETKQSEWIVKSSPNLNSACETARYILPDLGEVVNVYQIVRSWSNSDVGPLLNIYYSAGGNTKIRYSIQDDGLYLKTGPLTKADSKEKNEIILKWAIDEPNGPTFISPERVVLKFPDNVEVKEGTILHYVAGKLVGSKSSNNRKSVVMEVDLIIFRQSGYAWQVGYKSKFRPQSEKNDSKKDRSILFIK